MIMDAYFIYACPKAHSIDFLLSIGLLVTLPISNRAAYIFHPFNSSSCSLADTRFASKRSKPASASSSSSHKFESSSSSTYASSSAPLPPPSQFANAGVGGSTGGSKVKVLPALSAPVNLSSDSVAADADRLIEELMLEAERDPGLREMSGLSRRQQARTTAESVVRQKSPMAKRPYRTQQDMIIRDDTDSGGGGHAKHKMFSSPYSNRSRSADTRTQASSSSLAAAASRHARQASSSMSRAGASVDVMKRATSSDNLESEILGEVVNDNVRNHSVKDLVAMIEKNTNSESGNAYVRKWGCDLISPEPHTKNVTYRRERKRFENGDHHDGGGGGGGDRSGPKRLSTYNWTKDDEFQRKHLLGLEETMAASAFYAPPSQNQFIGNYDEAYGGGDSEFRMSSHVADLDSLLGRTRTDDGELEVQWPPPSNATSPVPPTLEAQAQSPEPQYRSQDFHIPRHVRIATTNGADDYSGSRTGFQQNQGMRYDSVGGTDVVDIDRQIKSIQNEFDSELDTLIDSYRQVQKGGKAASASYAESNKQYSSRGI